MYEFVEIPVGCPYHGFTTSLQMTCEAGLCAWIRQPINVLSSLAHLVVALYLFHSGLRNNSAAERTIGKVAILIAFSSMAAHATHIRYFGILDFTLQYLLMALLIWINFKRLGRELPIPRWRFAIAVWVVIALGQWFFPRETNYMYGAGLITLISSEAASSFVRERYWHYWDFFKCAFLFWAGVGAFFLDSWKIICDPNNHWFQMHAVWHVLSAWSLIYLARFYKQFDGEF